jgi:hypothetical protein
MTLVIEDGTNVSGANSYITEAEYTTWANARFTPSRSTLPASSAAYEAIILRAMDYFETLGFKGLKTFESQPLQWPRSNVFIDNYAVENDEIPKEVKTALYELAYAEEIGDGELNQIERKTERERVDVIEVTYASGGASRTLNPAVSRTLRKLLSATGGSGSSFMVTRK